MVFTSVSRTCSCSFHKVTHFIAPRGTNQAFLLPVDFKFRTQSWKYKIQPLFCVPLLCFSSEISSEQVYMPVRVRLSGYFQVQITFLLTAAEHAFAWILLGKQEQNEINTSTWSSNGEHSKLNPSQKTTKLKKQRNRISRPTQQNTAERTVIAKVVTLVNSGVLNLPSLWFLNAFLAKCLLTSPGLVW